MRKRGGVFGSREKFVKIIPIISLTTEDLFDKIDFCPHFDFQFGKSKVGWAGSLKIE
jgi:hypothetical protein